ncbi:MAG: ferritin-like domain-containing protein [Pseudonocardiaceae bacterium]
MRRGVNVLFRVGGPAAAPAMAVGAAPFAAEAIPLTLEVDPPMSPRDEAIFLLHTAAEIEHSLMVQYLYAAWSLPRDVPGRVERWRRKILQIAREEMAHFISVQNLLRFVGGPLNFDREDFPFRTEFYPFPFRLERLSRTSLARYIAAEMPAESDVNPDLVATAMALATGGCDDLPVNRVGALFNRLATLFADEQKLPDELFRSDTADVIQALPVRYRADVGRGPLYLRTVRSRAEALALLDDIANQGEGDEDMPRSHFLAFIDIFDAWPTDDGAISLAVPTHPTIATTEPDAEPATGQITHPRARAWGSVFNHHYRMLLGWLEHALLTPTAAAAGTGLPLRAFAEMLVLSDVGQLLTTLPRTEHGTDRAGAPFKLPYSLAFPDLPGDRWDLHRDLLGTARAQLDALAAGASDAEDATRRRVLSSITAAEAFIEAEDKL